MPAALRCESLEKRYGSVEALGGVDLEVAPGELLGLRGAQRAGAWLWVWTAAYLALIAAAARAAFARRDL